MTSVVLYEEMAPEVASVARAAAERIRTRMTRTCADIIEIGRDLLLVKGRVGHGNFLPWIDAEFGMSDQAARRFMHVAENIGDKFNTMLDLPPTVLYALAAPSTKETVREEAMRRVEAGEPVNLDVIADLKRQNADLKQKALDARRDEKVQKEVASKANEDRARILRDFETAKARAEALAREVEALKQEGVIHVYPDRPTAPPEPAPEPVSASKASIVRTAADLIADRFGRDTAELVALLREAGFYALASEIETASRDEAA